MATGWLSLHVRAGEGVEVPPGEAHKVANRSATVLELLVTSQPPSQGDRIDLESAAQPLH